jgi:26S proteasome regulatory subunit N11
MLPGFGGFGAPRGPAPKRATKTRDTAETIYIAPLALLKMLIHGRKGVPLEVMGLMLGEFVDEYTCHIVDVFAMPQSGTGVSVEAVDEVFQTQMLELLRQTNRVQPVVGWYHSHPGFGCWLSHVDCETQRSFENIDKRAIAVVVDPIQSVRGKVVMDAFRLISGDSMPMMGLNFGSGSAAKPRQMTSNLGHLRKPSLQAIYHNLNRRYYSINTTTSKDELDNQMLLSIHQKGWTLAFALKPWEQQRQNNIEQLKHITVLFEEYQTRLDEEETSTPLELLIRTVGKRDPKKQLEETVEALTQTNIDQTLTSMLDTVIF